MMQRWLVVTPEYQTYAGSFMEPAEYGSDVFDVEAETKQDAKLFAIQAWRKESRSYINQDRDFCPFTGLKVEEMLPCEKCGQFEACNCVSVGTL